MKIFFVAALSLVAVLCGRADSDDHSSLTIITAQYGADNVQRDVSALIRGKIKGNCLDLFANSTELGGYPAFGKVKMLQIRYSYQSHVYDQSFQEGQRVSLPDVQQAKMIADTPVQASIQAGEKDQSSGASGSTNLAPSISSPPISALQIKYEGSPTATEWIVNGKQYHNVQVGKIEADRVHITYDGGIGTLVIADLPPELRKRFINYDPAAAKAMADKRAQQAAQSDADFYAVQAAQDKQIAKQAKAEARRDEMMRNKSFMQGVVLEKTPDGLLVRCEMPEPVVSSMRSVGGGGNVYAPPNSCPAGAKQIYGTFLLKNAPDEASIVDNSAIMQVCYPVGTYSYTTVMGARKTVASYTAILPEN